MKKRFKKLVILGLAFALLLPQMTMAGQAVSADTVKIGLAYGTGALSGANLLNSTGSGYRLGYYDANGIFVQLGYTYETGISAVKTQNVWYGETSGGRSGYLDTATTGAAVGALHLQLPATYQRFEDALAACGQVSGFPAWIEGQYVVRWGAFLTAEEANGALATCGVADATVVGTSNRGLSVVKTGTSVILFQFDGATVGGGLAVVPGMDDSTKMVTWFSGSKYFGAFCYQRISGDDLTVINVLNREDYINCVVSQEMSDSTHIQALKAQAICARNYAAIRTTRHTKDGFDLCSTTHCQAYPGMGRIGANTTRAAAETAGQYLYYNGKIVETYYFSSDGGATEDVKNVWVSDIPYLKGVVDPWEATIVDRINKQYVYSWSVTYTAAELEKVKQRMQESGRTCESIVSIQITERTAMDNVRAIKITDTAGKSWTISGADKCRNMLGLRSNRYKMLGGSGSGYAVNESGTIATVSGAYVIDGSGAVSQMGGDAPYVITASGTQALAPASAGTVEGGLTIAGTGWGHGVGMSQWGAMAMAQAGKRYDEILKFYYTGVEVR